MAVFGVADLLSDNAIPTLEWLGTGPGVLIAVLFAVVLIVWATNAQQPETPPLSGPMPQSEGNREVEQLRKKLHKAEQERDELRAFLADPTAKRQRDEKMLRRACLKVAQEVGVFARERRYKNDDETVNRFKQRHEDKVTKLRDELDQHGWLTAEEREALTFRADDHWRKIGYIAETLRSIGMGH